MTEQTHAEESGSTTGMTNVQGAALAKSIQRRSRRRGKMPVTTILARDKSDVHKRQHTTIEVHRNGSLSQTRRFITSQKQRPAPTQTSMQKPPAVDIAFTEDDFAPEFVDLGISTQATRKRLASVRTRLSFYCPILILSIGPPFASLVGRLQHISSRNASFGRPQPIY